MNLKQYFARPESMSVAQLRALIGVPFDAQIRQWTHGYSDRVPSPENCVAIEQATERAVMRWDLRPSDWHRIWPELIGAPGAPRLPKVPKKAPAKAAA